MKNNNSNEYLSPPKSSSKPYERKIGINKIIPKNYFTETNIENLEESEQKNIFSPEYNFQTQTQNDIRYNENQNSKQNNFTEEFKKNQTENSDNIQNNFEYNSQEKYSKTSENRNEPDFPKKIIKEINANNIENISSENKNNSYVIKKNYQTKFIEGENSIENNNEFPKYNYK